MQGQRRERIGLAAASLILIVTMMVAIFSESDGVRNHIWRGYDRSYSTLTNVLIV